MPKFSRSKTQVPNQRLWIILIIQHISAKAAKVLQYLIGYITGKKNKVKIARFMYVVFRYATKHIEGWLKDLYFYYFLVNSQSDLAKSS
jgi:hypothetical protein